MTSGQFVNDETWNLYNLFMFIENDPTKRYSKPILVYVLSKIFLLLLLVTSQCNCSFFSPQYNVYPDTST